MKKQIFTIILLLMGGISTFGQFKLDGGINSLRLQTGGLDRLFITPAGFGVAPGNVGIGTLQPNAKLTVAGDMALQKIQRETVSGGYTDYDRQDASIAIFENGGTISGIQGGSRGQMLFVLCGYGTNQSGLTIRHDAVSNPTAANRILTHTGADFVISSGAGGVLLIYDDTKARWRIVETPSGSGTAGWGLTGNAGTNPATQFIGTTDAQDLAFKTNNTEKMRVASNGNVGIGTNTPDATLDIYGNLVLSKNIVFNGLTGTVNNLNTTGASLIRYNVASNVSITGIAGGVQGQILIFTASSNSTIILKYLDSGSSTVNQIFCNTGADITITGGTATLLYSGTVWYILSVAP